MQILKESLINHFLYLLLLACLIFYSCSGIAQGRVSQTGNSMWKFSKGDFEDAWKHNFNDNTWGFVNIPHTWNDKDVLPDGERGYYRGPGWYRKIFPAFELEEGERLYIYFEGANQELALYINESWLGSHIGGYSGFCFDITSEIKNDQPNLFAIKVDNSHNPQIPPLSGDFTFFGGIYRDIKFIKTSNIHFDLLNYGSPGIFINTPNLDLEKSDVKIRGSLVNHEKGTKRLTVESKIFGQNNEVLAQGRLKLRASGSSTEDFELNIKEVRGFELWSPDHPNLYRVETRLLENDQEMDLVVSPLGFRWFSFDPKQGFSLNGEPLKLIGANRHQDYWGLGNALSDDIHRRDLKLLKDMGGNFIRIAHYPQDPSVLEAADQLGLLVWEETPLVNEVTIDSVHHQNAENMLKEMIRQHYNHPSVILWGYMNEIYWAHRFIDPDTYEAQTQETIKLTRRLEAVARAEDPGRYTAMALHNYPLYEETNLGDYPMVIGWNLYHGWYYDKFEDFGKFMDEQHRKYPERIHFISEYGAGSDVRLHSLNPERFDFTIEGQKEFHESFYKQIMDRPYIAGGAVWNLIDFSSERRIDTNPHLNNKGLVEGDRSPKDVYFFYQAALSDKPILKIAESNWTYRTGYPESKEAVFVKHPVQIYSNLDEVELLMNGKSLGSKKVENFTATWEVEFRDGIHIFEAVNQSVPEVKDLLRISFGVVPFKLKTEGPWEVAINAGSNHDFLDDHGMVNWITDKQYQPGSWGYKGGKPLYIGNKIGSKEDILTIDHHDPLYQTARVNPEGYYFDVTDGWYEVELLFTEPFPRPRRFVDGVESPEHSGGINVFDVRINGHLKISKMDLLKEFGYNYPLKEKFIFKVENNHGIRIEFKSHKGEAKISGLKIRKY